MYGTLVPFSPEVQPAVALKRPRPAQPGDDAKSTDGGTFGSVLATAVTAKTPESPDKLKPTAAKNSPADADANAATLAAILQQTTQLPLLPADQQTAAAAAADQTVGAVGAVAATESTGQASTPAPSSLQIPVQQPTVVAAADVQNLVAATALPVPADTPPAAAPAAALPGPTAANPTATPDLAPILPIPTLTGQKPDSPIVAAAQPVTPNPVAAAPAQPMPADQAVAAPAQLSPQSQVPPDNVVPAPAAAQATALPTGQVPPPTTAKANPVRVQTPVPVNPAPAVPAQPAAAAPVTLQSSAQTVVAAASDSKPSDNGDNLAAGNLFDTDTAGDKPGTASGTLTQFAGILDQQAAKVSQPADQAPDAAQSTPRPDPYDIAGQIVQQARLITRPQNSEMIIRLKPEHLGELTMRIVVENGTVSAAFHSSNPDVRAALEASQLQFRQEMTSQGLKVNDVGIYASLDQFSGNQQPGYSQQPVPKVNKATSDAAEAMEAVEATSVSTAGLTATSGIDYRV